MKCSSCGYDNIDGAVNCATCNNLLNAAAVTADAPSSPVTSEPPAAAPPAAPPKQSGTPSQAAPYAAPPYPSASSRTAPPYPYQPPSYVYPAFVPKEKQLFTITDAYIVIGFVLAIVGVFVYAFLLLPISIGFSVVGFVKRTNSRTHGLSLAGIVVGVVACLIKVGLVLNELGLIPDWLSAGIF